MVAVGDEIATVHRAEKRLLRRDPPVPLRRQGHGARAAPGRDRLYALRRRRRDRRGQHCPPQRQDRRHPRGGRLLRAGHQRPGRAHRRQGGDHLYRVPPYRGGGPRHHRPAACEHPHGDRPAGYRHHVPHRPGPAGADHRRPPDRQDRHRPGHHFKPEGQRGHLHLRGHRPEGQLCGGAGAEPGKAGGHGLLHRGQRLRQRHRHHAVHRPLRRLRTGRVLYEPGQGRAHRLRRPDQARHRLPGPEPAAGTLPRPGGLPRGRVLPALPAFRALCPPV